MVPRLEVARLGKRYLVDSVIRATTEALKKRLQDHAPKECDAEVFQAIFSASIREDLPAVRTAAVEVAKTSATIRSMYDKHDLQESIHKRFPGGYTKGRRSKIGSRWS